MKNQDNYTLLFEKVLDLIEWDLLKKSSYKLNINYRTISNHLKSHLYFHISKLDSLRDIEEFMRSKSELTQVIERVSLGSLSNYNNNLNYEVLLPILKSITQKLLVSTNVSSRLKKFGTIKLIDSTTISVCSTYFKWAEYRSKKSGVKMHTRYDLGKGIPDTIVVTNAKVQDNVIVNELNNDKNAIYIFDRAYLDLKNFDKYFENKKFFITRLKENSVIGEILGSHFISGEDNLLDADVEIIYDNVCHLGNPWSYETKHPYRIIKITGKDGKQIVFATNLFHLSTEEIAWLYKQRWNIEIFFKWIKQNLKIKKFIGYSHNAVMQQIISTIISFLLLKLIQQEKPEYSLTNIHRKIKHCISKQIDDKLFSWRTYLGS